VADAHIRNGTATTNYGGNATVEVKTPNTGTDTIRRAFLRFPITGVQTNVLSAKLRVYGAAVTSAKSTALYSVADVTWSESTITWNSPVVGGPAVSAMPLQSLTVSTTAAFYEFDVTSYVQAQKTAGASAISLSFRSAVSSDEGPTTFNSKENAANKPVLVISSRP
jgi:hypothetical protein